MKNLRLFPSLRSKFGGAFFAFFTLFFLRGFGQAPNYNIVTTGGNITITDNTGSSETLAMSQSGSNLRFMVTGRTYSLNGNAPVNFPYDFSLTGVDSIALNTAIGDDIINIAAFTDSLPNLTVNGGTGDDVVNFNGNRNFRANASLNVDLQNDDANPGIDNVNLNSGPMILSGSGSAVIKVSRSIYIAGGFGGAGGTLKTANGDLTLEANMQPIPTSGTFNGIHTLDTGGLALIECTGTGNLTIKGTGGDIGGNNIGIFMRGGRTFKGGTAGSITTVIGFGDGTGVFPRATSAIITSNGGDVYVEGTGGTSIDLFGGVISAGGSGTVTVIGNGFINMNVGSTITSTGGDVSVTTNLGSIQLSNTSIISAGGMGSVTVNGNNATGSMGVSLAINSIITSNGGAVSVTGQGGPAGGQHHGINIQQGGQITAGDMGTVTVVGIAGPVPTGGACDGIHLTNTNSRITSNGGDVIVTGIGGGGGTSGANYGVSVSTSAAGISAGGNGTVTVNGTGGTGTGISNYGVFVSNSSITSSGGLVSVTGQGGGTGTSSSNFGINVSTSGVITGGNGATVIVNGTGGPTSGASNYGVLVNGAGATITSFNGNVSVIGQGGGTGSSIRNYGVSVQGAGVITGGTGGTVTVNGTGGPSTGSGNNGVYVQGAGTFITSSGGDISVTGTKGLNSVGAADIFMEISGMISATAGAAIVTLNSTLGGTWPNTAGTDVSNTSSSQSIQFANNSKLNIRISGLTVNTQYQQLGVVGLIDLNNAALTFTGSTHIPVIGQTFTIVNNDNTDAVIGTFNGLPEGGSIPNFLGSPTLSANISYIAGTDNNDVVLTVVSCVPPVITCPSNISVFNTANQCGANVSFTATATGTSPVITYSPASGSFFPVGITNVTATATNACGTSTCSFTVTVVDNEAPAITCPASISVNNDAGLCSAVVSYTAPIGTDNCGSASTSLTSGLASGSAFPAGVTTNTFTVSAVGGTSSCSFTITVADNEPPAITCPENISVNNDAGECSAVVNYIAPVGTDNCGSASTSLTSGFASGSAFPVGVTTNTFSVSAIGGTSSCSFTVTVADNENPTITCPATVIVNANTLACSATGVNLGAPTTADNCAVASTSNNGPVTYPSGATTVVWTVTDNHSNTATCSQTVTVSTTLTASAGADQYVIKRIGCTGFDVLPSANLTGSASGGQGPYTYSWSPAAGLSCINCASPIASPNVTTTYTLTATDAIGCQRTDQVLVTVINTCNTNNLPCVNPNGCNQVYVCNGTCYNIANVNANCASQKSLCWYLTHGWSLGQCGLGAPACRIGDFTTEPENPGKISFTAFPNPTDGNLTIRVSNGNESENATFILKVIDVLGRELQSRAITINDSENEEFIDMNGLAKGVYTIIIQNEETQLSKIITKN